MSGGMLGCSGLIFGCIRLFSPTHRSNRKGVSDRFHDIYKQLASSLRKCVDIAREKGASSLWHLQNY